ncbi:MAG: hypothetical protein LBV00_11440 [Propionibacteriaceae bacterium]|jgi:hypothetical protein|nr:hypothetical protein [Propionibacteriaceae bacterium]
MEWWVTLLVGAVPAIFASLVTWRVANQSHKTAESQTRVNEFDGIITGLKVLTERLQERVAELDDRVTELEDKRRTDALTMRGMGDHIDRLERHIWASKGPPPPPRPPGL